MSEFDLLLNDSFRHLWNLLSLAGYVTTSRSDEQKPIRAHVFPWHPTSDESRLNG